MKDNRELPVVFNVFIFPESFRKSITNYHLPEVETLFKLDVSACLLERRMTCDCKGIKDWILNYEIVWSPFFLEGLIYDSRRY